MALTRKFLQAMGIDADKIDEIITAHSETVNALKEERDGYKEDAEKLGEVQKELDKAKARVTELEDSANNGDKWKVKYDALKDEYDEYKSGISAKETRQKKSDAYRALLKEMGVAEKRLGSVLKVTDLDAVEFDSEGKLKDADKLKETIKTEWADFIQKKSEQGADTQTPPENNGGDNHTPSRAAQVAAKRYEQIYGKAEETK